MRKKSFFKITIPVLSAIILGLFGTTQFYAENIPDSFYIQKGNSLQIASYPALTISSQNKTTPADSLTYPETQEVSVKLFGIIPVKSVEVCRTEQPVLIAGGMPFGIKLLMDGVMVVKLSDSENCPAECAGIEVGDIIREINNIPVSSNNDIQKIISESEGNSLSILAVRNGKEFIATLNPEWNVEKSCYLGGMWVRDSIAGIGTVTFIDKKTGSFAGLGHPVCDSDTGEIIPVSSGKAVPVEITDVIKGKNGVPGELNGCFTSGDFMGDLELNNRCGVFGKLEDSTAGICMTAHEYKMGFKQDIQTGKAHILCTTEGCQPEKYEIEIESINYSNDDNTKNMVIRITDERLLEKTGGIVQGMSGSPIIQNNCIIGAVTHVFISDSAKGYGIFAENMIEYIK